MSSRGQVSIHVNGTDREVPSGLSVHSLLEHLDLNPALVVVEKNLRILDRNLYDQEPVGPGDRFELVHFVGGG